MQLFRFDRSTQGHMNLKYTSTSIQTSAMYGVFRNYEKFLARKPFITQIVSAGALAGTGDVIGQVIVEGRRTRDRYDLKRTTRFAGLVTCLVAPITYRWFQFLEGLRGSATLLPLKRVLIDQSIMAPLLTFTFITVLHLVEGGKPEKAFKDSRKQIWPVLLNNYKVWPLVQLLNFYFVPLRYRIVLVQTVGIFWNAYLSHVTQGSGPRSATVSRAYLTK